MAELRLTKTRIRAGVWEGVPQERPEFRAETRRQVIKLMKKRKAEEMI